jgi:hypothetical protein
LARDYLEHLLDPSLAEPQPNLVRHRIALLAQQEASSYERMSNISKSLQLLSVAKQYAGDFSDLSSQLEKDMERLRRKQQDPFAKARDRFIALSKLGMDEKKLRIEIEKKEMRKGGKNTKSEVLRLPYSLWTNSALKFWTFLLEPETIYSMDSLTHFSGRQVGRGEGAELTELALSGDSPTGESWFVVLAYTELPEFLTEDTFHKAAVNDPSSEAQIDNSLSQAERLERVVSELERAIREGRIVTGGFEFTVLP